jgi:hypothetical protein
MRSHLCILKTVKPLKMILDSAMASKMKKYLPQKNFTFLPGRWFSSKNSSWSLGGTKPFTQ